jgi:hypothetical protein
MSGDTSQVQYLLPEGMTVCEALHSLFSHYSSPWKSTLTSENQGNMIDGVSFVKMCKEAPGLSSKNLTRHEFDIIFTKAKPQGARRLLFENFLEALLDLSMRKYPNEDPSVSFSKLLSYHLFGLFDIRPAMESNAYEVVRTAILNEK